MHPEDERPRPHGDSMSPAIDRGPEDNRAQQQSDASQDAIAGEHPEGVTGSSGRTGGRGSTSNGVPSSDEDSGDQRRKQYEDGAGLVSEID